MELRRSAYICLLALAATAVSQQPSNRPIPITWNTDKTFGPDGPWQAVQVSVGTGSGEEQVSLYPGGSFDSDVFTPKSCNSSTAPCAAGGLYDPTKSDTADFNSIGAAGSITSWGSDVPMNLSGEGVFTLDTMSVSSVSTKYPIPNSVFSSVVSTGAKLPNGSVYEPVLGNLALGSPNPVQTFLGNNGTNVTGQLLTGYLSSQGQIPSSSFGLHIGSASLGQVGSLVLGGYDQSRVIGQVASIDTSGVGGEPIAGLVDSSIGVEAGGTPFNATEMPSLFRADGNLTMQVMLNPLVPYMFLPASMCDAFAQWLPLTWQDNPGLYMWNTNDYRYQSIVKSPAYLSFTFQTTDAGNMTVKVPFSLLNLTLESPLVASPTQYFPCKPYNSPDGVFYLGRAFLQAAYLGISWDQAKFFLAQAAGPGASQPSVQIIKTTDNTLESNPTSAFLQTWQSKWTLLPANASSSTNNATSVQTPTSGTSSSGLSTGAIIGIGVGVGVLALLLLGGLIACLCIRSRRRKAAAAKNNEPLNIGPTKAGMGESGLDKDDIKHPFQNGFYNPHFRHEMEVPPHEMEERRRIHEASGQTMVHEAPSSGFLHEAPSDGYLHEAPSSGFFHEIDSREVDRRSPHSAGSPVNDRRTNPHTPNSDTLSPMTAGRRTTAGSADSESLSPLTGRRTSPQSPVGANRSPVSPRRSPVSPQAPEGMI
ncbi:hypothetical protein MMC10_008345 [Thelotrema lepadinum]|nr:hypothetical protein [Thelotrema lepadinum]